MSPLLVLAAVATQGPARPPVTLHVGDSAPPITVVQWLKGTPQTDLKDGKVHVVEFWATWCGPCKVGMPHLSALAKRYGDGVVFVGVDASERQDDVSKPAAFVQRAGPMMAYNVAYATPKGPMTQNWMQAAGQYGIPCCFVVDRQGRVGWIGHPLMGLEQALDLAVTGSLTPTAADRIGKEWDARLAAGEATGKAESAAERAGKIDEALALNERLASEWPFAAPDTATTRYALLTAKDPAQAKAYGAQLLKEASNAPYVLRAVAMAITDDASEVKGARDYRLATDLIAASDLCLVQTAAANTARAKAEYSLGNRKRAAKIQAWVVESITQTIRTTDFGTTPNGLSAKAEAEKALAEAQATLERYRAAAGKVSR